MEFKILFLFTIGLVSTRVLAISETNINVKNTITEEERRGHSVDELKFGKEDNGKHSRGAYSSGTQKHQSYFYPSAADSNLAATGHGFLGGSGSSGGHGQGSGYGSSSYGSSGHGSAAVGGHSASIYGSGHSFGGSGHGGSSSSSLYGGSHGFGGYGGGSHGYGGGGGGIYGGGQFGGHNSALALKSLLIPLAGIALLGAAAALSTNPVLLQLGVVNGKRRKRSINQFLNRYPVNPYLRPDDQL